ncbi:MAG TPA: cobalt ECF transporter T component CbiQ [Roseiflexaceae bacterium]|nr:cobalt ECF transporter T component CbiQ [Roseiflexaceae bacterium]
MHTHFTDPYQAGTSQIHRLDPRVKVGMTLLFILSNALLPDGAWLAFLLGWLAVLALGAWSGLGAGYAVRRSFVALPFALAAVTAIFALPGRPLWSGALGPWALTATDAGVVRFASITARSWLSVQLAILLVATTRFPDVLHALRHLRVPRLLVAIAAFMYRYLEVLTDEAARLLRAREARSAVPPGSRGGGTLAWRAQVAGNMAGQLFLRSYERSDRIYSAMVARGYRGEFHTLNPHVMRTRDWRALALAVGALVLLQAVGRIPGAFFILH